MIKGSEHNSSAWANVKFGTGNANANTFTFSISETFNQYLWMSYTDSGGNEVPITKDNVSSLDVQLEKGSNASSYSPYNGNAYNIDLPTENKFDISKIIENTFLTGDGTTGTSNVTNLSDYIQILPSKPCTISYTYTTLMNTNNRGYCWYTENKTFISGNTYSPFVNNIPVTLTAPSNAKYIRFSYDKNCTNIQLQQSSKATPYGTTPIELCSSQDGTKRDYFLHDKTLDKWYWHREIGKVVLNGSESGWSYLSANRFNLDNVVDNYLKRQDYITYLSNYYEAFKQSIDNSVFNTLTTNTNYGFNLSSTPANNYTIRIKDTRYTSIANFKSWLSTNNVKIYYILATPTNTEITYQPLIDQLNLLEKAMSKDGQTNISQVNNDLPFIINASALLQISD